MINNKENKRNKIKFYVLISIIIFIVFVVGITNIVIDKVNYENRIQLTQLKNNSHSQMMGYIIKTINNKVIVIDGGTKEDSNNLKQHINELGGKVDVWFLTHPHKDHVGAFINLQEESSNIQIDKIYVTLNDLEWYVQNEPSRKDEIEKFFNVIQKEKIKNKIEEVNLNQNIQIDNVKCEVLGIKNPEIIANAINNSSMVIKMYINNKSILFLGDTGSQSSEKLLQNVSKEKLKSNIVQMAHHGQSGATQELYKAIKPQICLWPTPDWLWNNDGGEGENTGTWKTLETRSWIQDLKVTQNIIEKDGNITINVY